VSLWLLAAFAVVFATAAYVFQRALGIPVVDAIYFTGTVLTTTGFGDFNLQGSADAVKLFGVTMMFAGAALLAAVYAVVADVVLAVRLEQMLGRTSHRVRGHVVVVGLGRVGYRTACALLDMGRKVIAIEKDAESPFVEEIRRRAPVVIGDARYARTLAAANVAGAESVAALTENDVLNLEIALASRKAAPGIRVVVRTWDRDLAARLARHGGIDRALSASALAAPAFVEAVLRPDVLHAFDWDGRRVEVVSGTATAGGNEGVLLSRRPGTDGSWAFTPGSASPGDEVIRVRMPGAQPIESSAATSAPIASR
jgi:Trk K+ transport system NAD-binding subunit